LLDISTALPATAITPGTCPVGQWGQNISSP